MEGFEEVLKSCRGVERRGPRSTGWGGDADQKECRRAGGGGALTSRETNESLGPKERGKLRTSGRDTRVIVERRRARESGTGEESGKSALLQESS